MFLMKSNYVNVYDSGHVFLCRIYLGSLGVIANESGRKLLGTESGEISLIIANDERMLTKDYILSYKWALNLVQFLFL